MCISIPIHTHKGTRKDLTNSSDYRRGEAGFKDRESKRILFLHFFMYP